MYKREELLDEIAELQRALEATTSDAYAVLYGKQLDYLEAQLDNLRDPLVSGWIEEAEAQAADYADLLRTQENARDVGL